MAKKDVQVEENNVEVKSTVAPEEAVNVAPADPKVDGEATTTPDVSEETPTPKRTKAQDKADAEFDKLVEGTINGNYGTGRERMLGLGENYAKVQQEITRRVRTKELERLNESK